MVRFGVWLEFLRVQIQGNIQEVALTTFLLASMVIFSSHSLNNLHISFFILSLILCLLWGLLEDRTTVISVKSHFNSRCFIQLGEQVISE